MKETELKAIIDQDTYTKIKRSFNWQHVFEQGNHYYTDKAGVLRENRVMVRVRVIDGVSRLQVKIPQNENSPLQICDEREFNIEGIPEKISADIAKKITGCQVGTLYHMGSAVTKRRTIKNDTSELCLDKTTYFGKTDYEAELEYVDKISANILSKLMLTGVDFKEKAVSKFARFLSEWEKQNNS